MYVLLRCVVISVLVFGSLAMMLPGGGGRGPCPGCPVDATTDDFDVIKAATYAVRQLGAGHQLMWVRNAQTQVVAGTNYFLSLKILKFGAPKNCRATVWYKLDGTMELTDTNC